MMKILIINSFIAPPGTGTASANSLRIILSISHDPCAVTEKHGYFIVHHPSGDVEIPADKLKELIDRGDIEVVTE